MIEILEGLPDNVVGIVVTGRVTRKDGDRVLLPVIRRSLEWHYKLRLYYEIRSRYPGALWDDLTPGLTPAPLWERVAIVTDLAWIRYAVTALRLVIAGEVRVFAASQVPEGLAWITAPPLPRAQAKVEAGASVRNRRSRGLNLIKSSGGVDRSIAPAAQYLHDPY